MFGVNNQFAVTSIVIIISASRIVTMSTSASSSGWLVDEQGQWYMQHGHWIARVDPASQSVYYQDLRSHKTQWETPGDWSVPCAPSRKPKKLPARCLDFSHRAARCQVDPDTVKKTSSTPEGAGEFNIWYGRWVGELWNEHHNGMISFPVAFATPVDIYKGERTRACVYVCAFVRVCVGSIPTQYDHTRLSSRLSLGGYQQSNMFFEYV